MSWVYAGQGFITSGPRTAARICFEDEVKTFAWLYLSAETEAYRSI